MGRRTAVALAVLLGVGLFVGGGAAGYALAPAPGPASVSEIDRSRASTAAPAAFRDRRPFRSCGDLVLGQGARIPATAIACLAAGGGRELAVAAPTTEGDLIVTFFRTGPGIDGVDVFADTSRDRYGPRGWSRTRCPTRVVDPGGVCA